MPLPPKSDPRRPLHLAVRWSRVLGVAFVLLGLCGTLPILFLPRAAPPGTGGGGMPTAFMGIVIASSLMFYIGPGICYLVFASYLSNYRRWAVTATLVIVALHLLLVLVGGAGVLITLANAPANANLTVMWIPFGIVGVLTLAMGQMLYHLTKSYESVKHPPFGREGYQGFAPVFPVEPPPAGYAHPGEPVGFEPQTTPGSR